MHSFISYCSSLISKKGRNVSGHTPHARLEIRVCFIEYFSFDSYEPGPEMRDVPIYEW